MKPHIHFYSDCPFFGGCENMLANFFNDRQFTDSYRVTFSYRYSKKYEEGLSKRVPTLPETTPLRLADFGDVVRTTTFKPLKFLGYVAYHLLLIKYLCIAWNFFILYRFFGREKVDVLHVNNGGYPGAYSCMAAVFAARMRGFSNIVYVVNNTAFPYRLHWRWMDYFPDRLVVGAVSKFVCGSSVASRALVNVLGLSPYQAVTLPNGIALREVTESKARVIQRLGIDSDRIVLAVVAILEERKGHIYLLRAMELLKTRGLCGKMPVLVVEGTGTHEQRLRKFVSEAGLTEDVRFIGTESNVFNLLDAADVVILPSISHEDFPNIVLEAMGLGKTVIASRLSGTPEQIEQEKSGLLVEPGDVGGLTETIERVCCDEELRARLSSNARSRFNQFFSASVAVNNYRRLYDQLIEGGKK